MDGDDDGLIYMFAYYGWPKLKSLTLESLREKKDLKLTRFSFDIYNEDQIKRMFPGCNVEIKECEFAEFDQDGYSSDDYHFRGYDSDSYESDSDDLYDHRRYSDDSWDVSFDDGEQDSNA